MKHLLLAIGLIASLNTYSQHIDKFYHVGAGGMIGGGAAIFSKRPIIAGTFVALLAGIAEEIHDKVGHKSTFDNKDVLATALGGMISGIAVRAIRKQIHKQKRRR